MITIPINTEIAQSFTSLMDTELSNPILEKIESNGQSLVISPRDLQEIRKLQNFLMAVEKAYLFQVINA